MPRISALPSTVSVTDADELPLVQGGVTKRVSVLALLASTVKTSDARLTDARTPTGTAGGDLTGSYPNPTLNTVPIAKGGTGATSSASAISNLGAASATALTTHTSNTSNPHSVTAAQVGAVPTSEKGVANGVASLDSSGYVPDAQIASTITRDSELSAHTSNTSNPHSVTAAQVGNGTAQWNADKLQGRGVSTSVPATGNVLTWDGSLWSPAAGGGGGGSSYLNDLQDVTATSPTDGDTLVYKGTEWVNTQRDYNQCLLTNRWYSANVSSISAQALGANTGRLMKLSLYKRIPIDMLGFNVTTLGAGVARMAIYEFYSNSLVYDFGDINVSTTGAKQTTTLGTPIYLDPGLYLFLINANVAVSGSCGNAILTNIESIGSPTVGTTASTGFNIASMTYGAAPATLPAYAASALHPVIWFHIP